MLIARNNDRQFPRTLARDSNFPKVLFIDIRNSSLPFLEISNKFLQSATPNPLLARKHSYKLYILSIDSIQPCVCINPLENENSFNLSNRHTF